MRVRWSRTPRTHVPPGSGFDRTRGTPHRVRDTHGHVIGSGWYRRDRVGQMVGLHAQRSNDGRSHHAPAARTDLDVIGAPGFIDIVVRLESGGGSSPEITRVALAYTVDAPPTSGVGNGGPTAPETPTPGRAGTRSASGPVVALAPTVTDSEAPSATPPASTAEEDPGSPGSASGDTNDASARDTSTGSDADPVRWLIWLVLIAAGLGSLGLFARRWRSRALRA